LASDSQRKIDETSDIRVKNGKKMTHGWKSCTFPEGDSLGVLGRLVLVKNTKRKGKEGGNQWIDMRRH